MNNNTVSLPSVTSISAWARNRVRYLGGSELLPYVLKDDMYYYFSLVDGEYVLFCTTIRDLQYPTI